MSSARNVALTSARGRACSISARQCSAERPVNRAPYSAATVGVGTAPAPTTDWSSSGSLSAVPGNVKGPGLLLSVCNNEGMSVNVSVRLDDQLAKRLQLRARAAGESLSDRLRRYAEEGTRRDEHPMITFRDGPTGRRAGLIGGPDVWEVAMWIDDLGGSVRDSAAEIAGDGIVTRAQVDAAIRYRTVYPSEIQARIELHRSETIAAEAR